MDNPSSVLLITAVIAQCVTFAGVIATLVYNYIVANRSRRWLIEDRKFLETTTAATARDLKSSVESTAADLQLSVESTATTLAAHTSRVAADLKATAVDRATKVDLSLATITADLLETKQAAGDAYAEANHVNNKLKDMSAAALAAADHKARN